VGVGGWVDGWMGGWVGGWMHTDTRTFNPANDSAPLTHTHTRLVNVAVVDRKRMYKTKSKKGPLHK